MFLEACKRCCLRPATLLKKDSGAGVFLWILRNFWEHFFYRTPPDDCLWMILSLQEQMEFWKPWFQDTKKLLVISAKGKQDCKNGHRYFSLTLFELWCERNVNLFFSQKNYLQKQPLADVLSKNLLLKLSQYSQENTWRLEDLQLY